MKNPIPIHLAVEDDLSEMVVRRILSVRPRDYAIGGVFNRGEFGYLKKQTRAFNNAAKSCPFLLLTDLDKFACPPQLIEEWLGRSKHPNFLLRVAVREVESWLLGDPDGLGAFLGLRKAFKFDDPERLAEPKEELLQLALRSPQKVKREALAWKDDSSGRLFQGPDYNGTLSKFVLEQWNVEGAGRKCLSLGRFFRALESMESRISAN